MIIRLHIDRLVLEGASFAQMDRAQLGAAVQEQLATLLRDQLNLDALSAHHGTAAIRAAGAASPSVPAEATAAHWGRHIASAVHSAITRDARGESRGTRRSGPRDASLHGGGTDSRHHGQTGLGATPAGDAGGRGHGGGTP